MARDTAGPEKKKTGITPYGKTNFHERELWQHVVLRAIIDASWIGERLYNNGKTRPEWYDRKSADEWLRGMGRDFRMVCDMAGFDPEFVSRAYTEGRINLDAITKSSEAA